MVSFDIIIFDFVIDVSTKVYRMVATICTPTVQKMFTIESDIPYLDLRSRACANLDLDPATANLGYKISGHDGPRVRPSELSKEEDFIGAMSRICGLLSRARLKEYGIEIIDLVCGLHSSCLCFNAHKTILQNASKPCTAPCAKSKKRSREDDVPTPADPSLDNCLTDEYKKLAAHLKCESCKGYCYVMRSGQHQRLDYKEMSYWAKQNVGSSIFSEFMPSNLT